MAAAEYEIHDLEHLGLPGRQVTITCRHGETTRVFVQQRDMSLVRDRVLVRETADEHEASYGCGCAKAIKRQHGARRR